MKQISQVSLPGLQIKHDDRFSHLNRWTYLMMQAYEAKCFLELAENKHSVHPKSTLDELLTQQALFRSFILSYAKCFTSTGKGRLKLEQNQIYGHNEKLLKFHIRAMEIRHKFAAHSDVSGLDDAALDVSEFEDHFRIKNYYSMANPLNEYSDFKELLAKLEVYIVDKLNATINSLEKKLGKKIEIIQ